MFTPQRKVWTGWALSPRSRAPRVGSGSGPEDPGPGAEGKGKSIVPAEPVTPPPPPPGSNGMVTDGAGSAADVPLLEKEVGVDNSGCFRLLVFRFLHWLVRVELNFLHLLFSLVRCGYSPLLSSLGA